MATQTKNIGLVKPEIQDNFNLKSHLNDNWDKIDTEVNNRLRNANGSISTNNIAKKAVTIDKLNDDVFASQIESDNTKLVRSGTVYSALAESNTKFDTKLQAKADKSTTLDGYGITDAYTKTEVKNGFIKNEEGAVKQENIDTNAVGYDELKPNTVDEGHIETSFKPYIKNNYVSPEMFGAVGDGVTDDTEKLQSMFDYAVANDKSVELGSGKVYIISDTLRYDTAKANFNGNWSTIKVADNCTKKSETYYRGNEDEPVLSGSWKINSVITVNVQSGENAKYSMGTFKQLIIDCNGGQAKHALKIENEGKTNYAHIMIKNPALYGVRSYSGNEATFSYIHGCRSGVSELSSKLIAEGWTSKNERLRSTMLFLGCSDTYATDCISIDFETGFLTGGSDNHFNKCHAWCAYNSNLMSLSNSFVVWGGCATFTQCTVDSTRYGFKFYNRGRALITNCVNGYNDIYKNNVKTFGVPYLLYYATDTDTSPFQSTFRGAGTIINNSDFKVVDEIGCYFDNLGNEGDDVIRVDYTPNVKFNSVHVKALDVVDMTFTQSKSQLIKLKDIDVTVDGCRLTVKNNHISVKGTATKNINTAIPIESGISVFEQGKNYIASVQNLVNNGESTKTLSIYLWGTYSTETPITYQVITAGANKTTSKVIDTTSDRAIALRFNIATGTYDKEFDFQLEENTEVTPFEPLNVIENIANKSVTKAKLADDVVSEIEALKTRIAALEAK